MSLNDRAGEAFDTVMDRFGNIMLGCTLLGAGIVVVVLILALGVSLLFGHPDDRTCVHRHPQLVGKVLTYVCDEWGTASPTDPRP